MRPQTRRWETRVRRQATKRYRKQAGKCYVEDICLVLVKNSERRARSLAHVLEGESSRVAALAVFFFSPLKPSWLGGNHL